MFKLLGYYIIIFFAICIFCPFMWEIVKFLFSLFLDCAVSSEYGFQWYFDHQ